MHMHVIFEYPCHTQLPSVSYCDLHRRGNSGRMFDSHAEIGVRSSVGREQVVTAPRLATGVSVTGPRR